MHTSEYSMAFIRYNKIWDFVMNPRLFMNKGRIIVELPKKDKVRLEQELNKKGKSISSWIIEQVEDVIKEKSSETDVNQMLNEFLNMSENKIIDRLKKLDWSFTEAKTNAHSHGIHPYPAKFIPQIPGILIAALSKPGDLVWDLFGGSGTTAFEAVRLGRRAISTDLNPIATLVASTKLLCITHKENEVLRELISKLETMESISELKRELKSKNKEVRKFIPEITNIEKWFHKNAILELGYIRFLISSLDEANSKMVANTALSKIIVRSSYQDGETRYVSKPRDVKSGTVISYFTNELETMRKKVLRNSNVLKFRSATCNTFDVRRESKMLSGSVDLVVTSPPYPNSTDYHLYHRFRLFWLGYNPKDIADAEIGSHLRAQRQKTGMNEYVEEMTSCLREVFRVLRAGKYSVFVVGSGVFKGKEYDTAALLTLQAKRIGYKVVASISRPVHASKRSFVAPARRLKEEKIIILKKPDEKLTIKWTLPSYKLFPYEKKIRDMEIKEVIDSNSAKAGRESSVIRDSRKLTFVHSFSAKNYAEEKTWQAILENGSAVEVKSNRKDPKYVTHGLHEYKGKFYPQLAKSLFNIAGLRSGNRVLDPFCGSGTVLLEGYLNGLNAEGLDLNPLAIKIARVKTDILSVDPFEFDRITDTFLTKLESTDLKKYKSINKLFNDSNLKELNSWFSSPVLIKLGLILKQIEDIHNPTIREFMEVCLSSIVRQVSQQEPRDLRIRRRKDALNDAPVVELFIKKVVAQKARIFKFWKISNRNPERFGSANVRRGDVRDLGSVEELRDLKNFDAVITSPPYATALPYIDTDRLSILVLFGLMSGERQQIENTLIGSREIRVAHRNLAEKKIEEKDMSELKSKTAINTVSLIHSLNKNSDVGFRRKNLASLLSRYYADMTNALTNIDSVVNPGGSIFFVIGNNKTTAGSKEVNIKSDKFLVETGSALGWKLNEQIPITVTQENRLHNKNSIKENSVVWFTKP